METEQKGDREERHGKKDRKMTRGTGQDRTDGHTGTGEQKDREQGHAETEEEIKQA